MKFLVALLFLTMTQGVTAMSKVVVRLKGVSSIEVIGATRPSCQMVEHRLQEYAKRTTEADLLLEWYDPYTRGHKQKAALRNILSRMDDYLKSRKSENVRVIYKWIIPRELYQEFKASPQWDVELQSSRFRWKDYYNGTLPADVQFKVKEGVVALAELTLPMNFETFCLEAPEVVLELGIPGLKLVMNARHETEEL